MNAKHLLVSLKYCVLMSSAIGLNTLINPAYAQTISQQEAENSNVSGGAAFENEHAGYSGTGYLGGFTDGNKGSAAVSFSASVPQSVQYTLATRYANGTGSAKSLSLYIDNQYVQQVYFNSGSHWADWLSQTNPINLTSGSHTISLRFDNQDSGNINLDAFTVISQNQQTVPTLNVNQQLELEDALLTGGAVAESNHTGFSGNGFVGGFTDSNKGQASSAFNVDISEAGSYQLTLSYANGTGSDRTISFNTEQASQTITLPATNNWDSWASVSHTFDFTQGTHQLSYLFGNNDSGNVNLDSVALSQVSTDSTDPTAPPVEPPTSSDAYEAEVGFYAGGAYLSTSLTGAQGEGAVVQSTANSSRIIATVNASQTGLQTVGFRYNNSSGITQKARLFIDGIDAGEMTFEPTTGFTTKAYNLNLHKGVGTLTIAQHSDSSAEYAIDNVSLEQGLPLESRGATTPYKAYEAENAQTNAQVLAPSRVFHTVAAEASGRQAVRLNNTGDFVEFTLTEAANAFVLRSSIPDNSSGAGQINQLAVFADGVKLADHQVSSLFSWVYGSYPYGNNPSQGSAQRFFDGSRMMLGQTLPVGTVLRFEKDANSTANYYDIDLLETELVEAPRAKPTGFVSITDFGAVADDGQDDLYAIQTAIADAKAQGTGVWIPQGRFIVSDRFNLSDVSVIGAGPWYSVIAGLNGKGGFYATGDNVTIAHLMIDGDVRYRDDAAFHAALEGNFGKGSLLQNIWVEHTKVGLWGSAGTDGLLAVGLRIRNTFADGVNLHTDIKDTHITQSMIRNTGDDALAMWSSGSPVTRSAFIHNTVQVPLLGNGAGIYGGTDNAVLNNLFADTLTGSAGVAIGTRFNPVPLAGVTRVENTTLLRTGGYEPNWQAQLGAIWIYADSADITAPIEVTNVDIIDSTHQAILVNWQKRVENLLFKNVYIDGVQANGTASDFSMEFQAQGNAYFEDVAVTNGASGVNVWPEFSLIKGSGNSGF